MNVSEIIDPELLQREIDAKMVRKVTSPEGDKHLYVYTEQAQYKSNWNDATINARGLVTTTEGEIISRPFPKFFNYGQHPEGSINPDSVVTVFDKLDGSLAVLGDDDTLTSKGSFTSHVVEHARELLNKDHQDFKPVKGFTYCFECIWPEGRIVLDYNGLDALVLLAVVENSTGEVYSPAEPRFRWSGLTPLQLGAGTLSEALELAPRDNSEGVVIHVHDQSMMIKLKQDDYVALHRIVTGMSAITIWEHVAFWDMHDKGEDDIKNLTKLLGVGPDRLQVAKDAGPDWELDIAEKIPDEFHEWLKATIKDLRERRYELEQRVMNVVMAAEAHMWTEGLTERKELVHYLKSRQDDFPEGVAWNSALEVIINENTGIPPRVAGGLWRNVRPHGASWGTKGEM